MSVDLMTTPNTPFLQKIQKHIELHHEALHGSEPVNQVDQNIKNYHGVKELVDKISTELKFYPNLHLSKETWRSYLKNKKFDEFIRNFDQKHLQTYVNDTDKLIIFKNLISGRIFFTITDSIQNKILTKDNLIFVVYNDGKRSKRIEKIVGLLNRENLEYSEFIDTMPSNLLSDSYTPFQRFRPRTNNNGPITRFVRDVSDDSDSDNDDDDDDDYEPPMRPSVVDQPPPPSDSYWPNFW
jgi:hypothetical protein